MRGSKTFILCHFKSKVLKILNNLCASWFKARLFQIINAMLARKKQTSQRVLFWLKFLTISSFTYSVSVSTMTSSKMKRSTPDSNSLWTLMFITTRQISKKAKEILKNTNLLSKESYYIMAVPNLVTISVISKNQKINGYSLMMRESGSLILMILKSTVLEENTGEEKAKAPTYWSMRKSRKLHSGLNSIR